mmetsp:Transcript_9208/g.15353  ORF Transcript_9208/g.15353 Transcript_9208/m.15353 type:complete len:243 (+) Transcript_9208:1153-1881(+)
MTGSCVPLHRATHTRVNVRFTGRHQTKLERGPCALHVFDVVFVDVIVGRLIAVRFRRHHIERGIVAVRHIECFHVPNSVRIKCSGLFHRLPVRLRKEHPVARRGIDHTPLRYTILHIGNVYREIATTVNKLLSAIQWVHDQKGLAFRRMTVRLLFSYQHHTWERSAQTSRNQRISRLICRGHRAVVTFDFHVKIIRVIDFHNLGARLDRQLAHHRDQRVVIQKTTPKRHLLFISVAPLMLVA